MKLLDLILFSSDGNHHNAPCSYTNRVLLHYSKGPCLGKHPKLDLWVFIDGRVLFKETFRGKRGMEIRNILSKNDIDELVQLLEYGLKYPRQVKKKSNSPVTTLKSEGKEFEYNASTVDGPLRAVEDNIMRLLATIQKTNST